MDRLCISLVRARRAFTLVELLVTMAILALLMVLLASITNQIGSVWKRTTGKVSAFQEARSAFEGMTRKIAQATVNPFWDYDPPLSAGVTPTQYVRQAELHFVAGPADTLVGGISQGGSPIKTTSHGVFFHAPLGYTASSEIDQAGLVNLVNASGFFIQYGSDQNDVPQFLATGGLVQSRNRYRLMELWQPTENLLSYQRTLQELATNAGWRREWFTTPLESLSNAKPLAENIVAVVVWPKRAANDPGDPLTTDYSYDTRRYMLPDTGNIATLTRNQLPPMLQVTMVALDEASAVRLEAKYQGTAPLLQPGALFTLTGNEAVGTAKLEEDLGRLIEFLQSERLDYRVFSTNITIRQAKWSEQ